MCCNQLRSIAAARAHKCNRTNIGLFTSRDIRIGFRRSHLSLPLHTTNVQWLLKSILRWLAVVSLTAPIRLFVSFEVWSRKKWRKNETGGPKSRGKLLHGHCEMSEGVGGREDERNFGNFGMVQSIVCFLSSGIDIDNSLRFIRVLVAVAALKFLSKEEKRKIQLIST